MDTILSGAAVALVCAAGTAVTVWLVTRHTMALLDRFGHESPVPRLGRVPQQAVPDPDRVAISEAIRKWEGVSALDDGASTS